MRKLAGMHQENSDSKNTDCIKFDFADCLKLLANKLYFQSDISFFVYVREEMKTLLRIS